MVDSPSMSSDRLGAAQRRGRDATSSVAADCRRPGIGTDRKFTLFPEDWPVPSALDRSTSGRGGHGIQAGRTA